MVLQKQLQFEAISFCFSQFLDLPTNSLEVKAVLIFLAEQAELLLDATVVSGVAGLVRFGFQAESGRRIEIAAG
jgi:hypothetical protein